MYYDLTIKRDGTEIPVTFLVSTYFCFLCTWSSSVREKHWVKRNWPQRSYLKPDDPNILREPVVDIKKIIFPFLHIKLCLMKQFFKALLTEGDCFKFLILPFPGRSIKKIKADMFNGPQILQLIEDELFIGSKSELEKNVWLLFV